MESQQAASELFKSEGTMTHLCLTVGLPGVEVVSEDDEPT